MPSENKILLLASTLLPILTLHAIVDTNDNGLSDLWEKQHNDNELFSETFDPEADPDSDGWTNAQEAAAGTDPFSTAHPDGHLQPETVQLPETWVDTDNDNIPDWLVPESIQVSWPTIPGKQYTFQSNATLAPDNWINVGSPFIGAGTVVNYGFFTTAAAKTFWRVNITDIDSDGDDLTDWEENELGTNPLHHDSDGDGLSDGWEITNSLDANDDRDRDGVLNSVDAEADEPLIDWQPSARPVFAVIELDVTDVENLMLDDFTETGTILLTNDTTAPNTRILVDRWQKVITFPAWGEGGPSAFSSYGPTLIGDTLPGERLINNLSKGYLMIPEMNGTQSFQPWENPTNYLDSIKDSRNGTTIAVDWLGPNPNWTNPGLGRFPDGNPLPNEETTASRGARIEADGNIVSDKVYWRKDLQTGNPGNAIPLPSVPTAVHSATVSQVTTGPTGAIEENHWNLVATHQGLLVSKNEGDFTSASGALAGVACDGVTRQGWIIDRTNQRIRSNGEWKTLLQLLGDGFSQAELLGILDTGLAVAKVKSSEPEADFKLALLLPVEVAVDADRDGEITFDGKDKTTAEKPFRFWINDDDDTFGEGNDTGGTLDRIPAVTPDHQNSFIDFIRDLEDFSRISFKLPDSFWSQIKAGEIQVGFKWSDTSDGNPAVNIFRQFDQSGGQVQYFVNEDEALNQAATFADAAQKVMTVSGTGTAYFPQSFIDRLPTNSAPTYLLFEGAAKGKGKLNLVLKVRGQEVVCDGPWIKLMDVRQFYTRGRTSLTATQINDPWDNPNPPSITSVPDNTPEFVPDPDETEQCIIHVHGWRMTEGDSRNWSEMTFKRLWQLHYKGRFATFRWATFSDGTHPNWGQSLLTYNRSEYRSWLCGPALAQFVNGLPYPGSRYLIAHSMGNVISGKALQAGMSVNRYVMCNAAMAAMSYDGSITNAPLSASSTPDTDSDPATAAFGLKNRFNDNLTTRINYYLPKDEALTSWIANHVLNKPEGFAGPYGHYYSYESWYPSGQKIRHIDSSFISGDTTRMVTSLAEAMGHVVKSRSDAVGAAGYAALGGSISSSVGMDSFGFDLEHSAEWNWSLTGSYEFWRKLFDSFDISTTAPQ